MKKHPFPDSEIGVFSTLNFTHRRKLWFSVETPCQIQGLYEIKYIINDVFTLFYSRFIHLSTYLIHVNIFMT